MAVSSAQVLIVGAGPVGLGLAIELGMRGVGAVVVERNDRVGYAPRAKTTNVRAREHMRRWGIAKDLAALSPLGLHYPTNVIFCTQLAGHQLACLENHNYCQPGRNPLYSEHGQWIPQYSVEEVMRKKAESLPGITVHFSTEMVSFAQDERGVSARLRDLATGKEREVTAAYLVGADGARSSVREAIGATMSGVRGIGRHYNVVFRSPGLEKRHPQGPGIMYWQVNAEVPSLVGPMDRDDRWFFMPTKPPAGVKYVDEDMPPMIRAATGLSDAEIEILSSDEWYASRLIADKYRDRRVFLAGDACHLHPPFGGFGMNMGICDAVDLGWKIAATLQGWGGPGLLGSYETERRPVHEMVLSEAVANHAILSDHLFKPGLEADTAEGAALRREAGARIQAAKMREFYTLGVVKGYHYAGSPIVADDGTRPPAHDFVNYRPSASPGCVAPHAWLHDGTSLYDRFGAGFTLLVTGKGDTAEIDRMVAAANAARVPLDVVAPELPVLADVYEARYALVRPDQHVAWRGDAVGDAGAILAHAAALA